MEHIPAHLHRYRWPLQEWRKPLAIEWLYTVNKLYIVHSIGQELIFWCFMLIRMKMKGRWRGPDSNDCFPLGKWETDIKRRRRIYIFISSFSSQTIATLVAAYVTSRQTLKVQVGEHTQLQHQHASRLVAPQAPSRGAKYLWGHLTVVSETKCDLPWQQLFVRYAIVSLSSFIFGPNIAI